MRHFNSNSFDNACTVIKNGARKPVNISCSIDKKKTNKLLYSYSTLIKTNHNLCINRVLSVAGLLINSCYFLNQF